MLFVFLTFISAISLALVAGWFSIIGFTAIYAGAPIAAIVMGIVTETAKLVTASWLYRNWDYASWKIKIPLIYFTVTLMLITSIGVFGFLSKAHIDQGTDTINNAPKIETLNYQIQREKSIIADNEKVIGQLDSIVQSYISKDQTNRALQVRKSQEAQRKQLVENISQSQKNIDLLNKEKFTLESELRSLQLEVGPIKYISNIIYSNENITQNIESAIRIFTLLIVSSLDPLAVILLIAANNSYLRLKNEKDKKGDMAENIPNESPENIIDSHKQNNKNKPINESKADVVVENEDMDQEILRNFFQVKNNTSAVIAQPIVKREKILNKESASNTDTAEPGPWAQQETVLRELLGKSPGIEAKPVEKFQINNSTKNKYNRLSWIEKFKGNNYG